MCKGITYLKPVIIGFNANKSEPYDTQLIYTFYIFSAFLPYEINIRFNNENASIRLRFYVNNLLCTHKNSYGKKIIICHSAQTEWNVIHVNDNNYCRTSDVHRSSISKIGIVRFGHSKPKWISTIVPFFSLIIANH